MVKELVAISGVTERIALIARCLAKARDHERCHALFILQDGAADGTYNFMGKLACASIKPICSTIHGKTGRFYCVCSQSKSKRQIPVVTYDGYKAFNKSPGMSICNLQRKSIPRQQPLGGASEAKHGNDFWQGLLLSCKCH